MASSVLDHELAQRLHDLAANLGTQSFRPLSQGLGVAGISVAAEPRRRLRRHDAVKPRLAETRQRRSKRPVLPAPKAPHPQQPGSHKVPPISRPQQSASWVRYVVSYCADLAFAGVVLMVIVAVMHRAGAGAELSRERWFEALLVWYGVYFVYTVPTRILFGRTLGEFLGGLPA